MEEFLDHNWMYLTWGISFCSTSSWNTDLEMVWNFVLLLSYFRQIQWYSTTMSFTVCSSACTVWKEINFTLLLCLQQQWKRISKCGRRWKEVLSMVRSVVYVRRSTWIQLMVVCVIRPPTGARMNHIRKLVQNTSRYMWFCLELI
jgi:hypothetical protein